MSSKNLNIKKQEYRSVNLQIYILILIIVVAIFLRTYGISFRPLQSDEGVNFGLVKSLAGFYDYNPAGFHGPTYFYLLKLSVAVLSGKTTTEFDLRFVSLIFGTLLCFIAFVENRRFSLNTLLLTSLLALSPSLIFLSKVAIHEICFVFCSYLFLLYLQKIALFSDRSLKNFILLGILGAISLSFKETFWITLLSVLITLLIIFYKNRNFNFNKNYLFSIVSFLIVVMTLFYQGNGVFEGLVESYQALVNWFNQGVRGMEQKQPAAFYLITLLEIEPLILLLILLIPIAIVSNKKNKNDSNISARYFYCYGMVNLLIYSAIGYKTAWLIINFIPAFYLAFAETFQYFSLKESRFLVFLICSLSAYGILQDNYKDSHPLQPIPSYQDVRELGRRLEAECNDPNCYVLVTAKDYWPLPFYLQNIWNRVSYQRQNDSLGQKNFDFVVSDTNPFEIKKEDDEWFTIHGRSRVKLKRH